MTHLALLNPMFGRERTIVGSGLMNKTQYGIARERLLRAIQDELDAKNPYVLESSDSEDSLDGSLQDEENNNYRLALTEFRKFENFKKQKYLPELKYERSISSKDDSGRSITIGYGQVVKPGANLPSEKNLTQYLDNKGRINLLCLFKDHSSLFPGLYLIVQREVPRRVTEVGCERFFGLSGYVSQPRRSRLGVKNYERIALLANILRNVFIDPEWVAAEYLRRCKKGAWKKENTVDAMKCFNLERILDAKAFGLKEPKEITTKEYFEEYEEGAV